MFRLKNIRSNKNINYPLSLSEKRNSGNYFTLITGENGSGKSTLLSKSVNQFIFPYEKYSVDNDKNYRIIVSPSQNEPERVIAICNSRYNRFTGRKAYYANKDSKPNYYIQIEHELEINKSVLLVMGNCLRELIKQTEEKPFPHYEVRTNLKNALKMIGLRPNFKIRLNINKELIDSYIKDRVNVDWLAKNYDADVELDNENRSFENDLGLERNEVIEMIKSFNSFLKNKSYFDLEFSLIERSFNFYDTNINIDSMVKSIKMGFLIPHSIDVTPIKSLKYTSIQSLSSGQQTLLMQALVISTFAKLNSLICIDEPENSLHPDWQLKYMSFINMLVNDNYGCHFCIATHSPQIISGMKSENGCVLTLKNNIEKNRTVDRFKNGSTSISNNNLNYEIHSISSYIKRSSDRQLMEVFATPGYANEFLIHRLLIILSKLSEKKELKEIDYSLINEVNGLIANDKIDKKDPVTIIFVQIRAFQRLRDEYDH